MEAVRTEFLEAGRSKLSLELVEKENLSGAEVDEIVRGSVSDETPVTQPPAY